MMVLKHVTKIKQDKKEGTDFGSIVEWQKECWDRPETVVMGEEEQRLPEFWGQCCVRHVVNVEDRKEGETRKGWIMMALGKAAITRVCPICEV